MARTRQGRLPAGHHNSGSPIEISDMGKMRAGLVQCIQSGPIPQNHYELSLPDYRIPKLAGTLGAEVGSALDPFRKTVLCA